jgi:aryl-alcohol dehydrogenase-like predicted oxidoreductase
VDALLEVSRALERSPAQVALNWVATRPRVASTIIGATKME